MYTFKSINEARYALTQDPLGTAYINSKQVFVCTAYGTGTFSREEWEGKKNENSNNQSNGRDEKL